MAAGLGAAPPVQPPGRPLAAAAGSPARRSAPGVARPWPAGAAALRRRPAPHAPPRRAVDLRRRHPAYRVGASAVARGLPGPVGRRRRAARRRGRAPCGRGDRRRDGRAPPAPGRRPGLRRRRSCDAGAAASTGPTPATGRVVPPAAARRRRARRRHDATRASSTSSRPSPAGTGADPGPAPPRALGVGGVLADRGQAATRSPPSSSARAARAVRLVRRASASRSGWTSCPLGADAGTAVVAAHQGRPRRLPAVRPGHRRRRRRGRVLRRAHDPAGGPGHARPAHRRAAPARPPSTTGARGHHGVVRPPIPVERSGRLRDDVARVTQALADELEELIRAGARAVAPPPAQLAQRPRPSPRPPSRLDSARASAGRTRRAAPCSSLAGAHRAGLPLQPHGPRRRAGPGARAGPRAAGARATRPGCWRPCDGPPPDAGVTPLGNSVPTAANGSVAPLAPDPSAQLRTIRALRDEDFDVLHLHEPLAPGPTMTALLFRNAPLVGHVPRRRATAPPTRWPARRALAGRPARPPRAPCRRTPAATPSEALGRRLRAAVQRHRGRALRQGRRPTRPTARRSSSSAATSSARAWPCCSTPWPTCRPTCGCGWAATGPQTDAAAGPPRRRPAHRVAGPPERRRRWPPACGAPTCSAPRRCTASRSASCCSRRWPPGPPIVAATLAGYANVAPTASTPCSSPPGDAEALAARAAAGARRRRAARPSWSPPAERGRSEFSMDRLAEPYVELYERSPDAARRGAGTRRRRAA